MKKRERDTRRGRGRQCKRQESRVGEEKRRGRSEIIIIIEIVFQGQ